MGSGREVPICSCLADCLRQKSFSRTGDELCSFCLLDNEMSFLHTSDSEFPPR